VSMSIEGPPPPEEGRVRGGGANPGSAKSAGRGISLPPPSNIQQSAPQGLGGPVRGLGVPSQQMMAPRGGPPPGFGPQGGPPPQMGGPPQMGMGMPPPMGMGRGMGPPPMGMGMPPPMGMGRGFGPPPMGMGPPQMGMGRGMPPPMGGPQMGQPGR